MIMAGLARVDARSEDAGEERGMAKLYFRYGTVSSAKTLNLLAVSLGRKRENQVSARCAHLVWSRAGGSQAKTGGSQTFPAQPGQACE